MATASTSTVRARCPHTDANKPGYALVIVYTVNASTKKKTFFMGKESVYRDFVKPNGKTGSMRNIPSTVTNEAGRIAHAKSDADFDATTDHIVLRLKPGTTDEWKYTIQYLPADPNHGFPKGGGKDKDEEGIDIAKREFQEETGYRLPRDPQFKKCVEFTSGNKQMVCVVFHLEINDTEKADLETAVQTKNNDNLGELFEGAFKTEDEINASGFQMNEVSRLAFENFDADNSTSVDQTNIPKGGEKPAAYVPPAMRASAPSVSRANSATSWRNGSGSGASASRANASMNWRSENPPANSAPPVRRQGSSSTGKYIPPHKRPGGGGTRKHKRRQHKQSRRKPIKN
jgi:hypothetical protein